MNVASTASKKQEQIFSRHHPSPRYTELLALYRQMHAEGVPAQNIAAEEMYSGISLLPHLPLIREMVRQSGARTLLDYGSGKGLQYRMKDFALRNGERAKDIASYLGVQNVVCYDPAVPAFDTFPEGKFGGVICTDVLEHCPEQDLPWILEEMFAAADKFVFANIASYPAGKTLPNGENAHCTVQPEEWWTNMIAPVAARYPNLLYHFDVSTTYS